MCMENWNLSCANAFSKDELLLFLNHLEDYKILKKSLMEECSCCLTNKELAKLSSIFKFSYLNLIHLFKVRDITESGISLNLDLLRTILQYRHILSFNEESQLIEFLHAILLHQSNLDALLLLEDNNSNFAYLRTSQERAKEVAEKLLNEKALKLFEALNKLGAPLDIEKHVSEIKKLGAGNMYFIIFHDLLLNMHRLLDSFLSLQNYPGELSQEQRRVYEDILCASLYIKEMFDRLELLFADDILKNSIKFSLRLLNTRLQKDFNIDYANIYKLSNLI